MVSSVKFCAHEGCRQLLPRGTRFCTYHQQRIVERKQEKIKAFGYKRANWVNVRRQRLEMANGYCELRLRGCTVEATHVHLLEEMQGNHDEATLNEARACCLNCSSSIDGGRAHGRKDP